MPYFGETTMSKTPQRHPKEDFTQAAFRVFRQAIGEPLPPEETAPLSPKAAAGQKGGIKGGKARAGKMTPEERAASARKAAAAR